MNMLDKVIAARNWNEEERMILDQVQRMTEEVIAPNAAKIDESHEFPWENVRAINELGLNSIFVPEDFG
ncbi:MAG: acyl-CoA dehydrogenase family protein, partial [Paracoccaceae bacterium]